jgi:hypothetical protein
VSDPPNPGATYPRRGEYLRIQRAFEAYYDTLPGDIEVGDPGLSILDEAPALVETIVALRHLRPERG